jgi:hypothetical protein
MLYLGIAIGVFLLAVAIAFVTESHHTKTT